MQVTTLLLLPKNDCQQSVNNFWACMLHNQTPMQQYRPIIELSAGLMGQTASDDITTTLSLYVHEFNFTNMHAISHRSDFFLACSFKADI
jgi:hypothetical protein